MEEIRVLQGKIKCFAEIKEILEYYTAEEEESA